MIPNPILTNSDSVMLCVVLCCVVILAAVMIPKAIRHRKQVRESKNENLAPDEEQELEMIVVPSEETITEHSVTDYKKRFFTNVEAPLRGGKLVCIRKKHHDLISRIAQVTGDEVTLFSYVDNVLNHHFENYRDEVSELYKQKYFKDYNSKK